MSNKALENAFTKANTQGKGRVASCRSISRWTMGPALKSDGAGKARLTSVDSRLVMTISTVTLIRAGLKNLP